MALSPQNSFPLHNAATSGDIITLRHLLTSHNVNEVDSELCTPLHLAALNGHERCVELLLERGAYVDAIDSFNATPLHRSCARGHLKATDILLKNGARVDSEAYLYKRIDVGKHRKEKPIIAAAIGGHYDIIEILLRNGADATSTTSSPLFFVVLPEFPLNENPRDIQPNPAPNAYLKCIDVLTSYGACLDQSFGSITAILALVWLPLPTKFDLMSHLIDKGSDINAQNQDGMNALHIAVVEDKTDCLLFLLERGADADCRNNDGLTPLELAEQKGKQEMVAILKLYHDALSIKGVEDN